MAPAPGYGRHAALRENSFLFYESSPQSSAWPP